MMTEDLKTIKIISSYQPLLHILYRQKDFQLPSFRVMHELSFSLTLIFLFISSNTCHLVILFIIIFTFPFLITKYQLGHC